MGNYRMQIVKKLQKKKSRGSKLITRYKGNQENAWTVQVVVNKKLIEASLTVVNLLIVSTSCGEEGGLRDCSNGLGFELPGLLMNPSLWVLIRTRNDLFSDEGMASAVQFARAVALFCVLIVPGVCSFIDDLSIALSHPTVFITRLFFSGRSINIYKLLFVYINISLC